MGDEKHWAGLGGGHSAVSLLGSGAVSPAMDGPTGAIVVTSPAETDGASVSSRPSRPRLDTAMLSRFSERTSAGTTSGWSSPSSARERLGTVDQQANQGVADRPVSDAGASDAATLAPSIRPNRHTARSSARSFPHSPQFFPIADPFDQ